MNTSEIEVGNKTPLDLVKVLSSIALVIGGFVFYFSGQQDAWILLSALLLSLVIATVVFLTSSTGQSLIIFFKAAYTELLRVVWPSRRETTQMTIVVFVFVIIMAIFLWSVDKLIELALFDLVLNWSK
ncbi:MAG: preprotein translocase subunit SecE [Pseudomonadota bacterium]|jgi:preprotein translocase subunit SecE